MSSSTPQPIVPTGDEPDNPTGSDMTTDPGSGDDVPKELRPDPGDPATPVEHPDEQREDPSALPPE